MKTIKQYYNNNLKTDFLLKNSSKNIYKAPFVEKVVLSIGVKEANINSNKILVPLLILNLITGQKPFFTKAKHSIANFKLRKGKIIGCKVTLKNGGMNNFFEKFIHIVLPQLNDMNISLDRSVSQHAEFCRFFLRSHTDPTSVILSTESSSETEPV